MIGIGFRREMLDWHPSTLHADFFEVVPENWIRRDRAPLHALRSAGKPVRLHGVSLNLGGNSAIDRSFLQAIRELMLELETPFYSDHLASSGDAHQLYDLFPIACTLTEVRRVSDRIQQVQDTLGCRIAVENTTWYTNRGDMTETDFISEVIARADCQLLLDLNNIVVNHKNHGLIGLDQFVSQIDLTRVSYMHVAGHEFNHDLDMFIDTHSQPVEPDTARVARQLHDVYGLDVLLEWDNDVPGPNTFNQEIACLRRSSTMCGG